MTVEQQSLALLYVAWVVAGKPRESLRHFIADIAAFIKGRSLQQLYEESKAEEAKTGEAEL